MSPLVPYTTLFRSARRREFFRLVRPPWRLDADHLVAAQHEHAEPVLPVSGWRHDPLAADGGRCLPALDPARIRRSEEHTSELQSLMRTSHAAFRLKKNKHITHQIANKSNNKP